MDLTQRIDELLVERDKQRKEDRVRTHGTGRNSFYVSDAGKCPRKIAYEYYELPKSQLDGRVLRILENGNFLQDRYSAYFKELGVWVAEEVPVSTEAMDDVPILIRGRADILINAAKLFDETGTYDKTEPPLEDLAIVEMKSINTWGFKSVVKDNLPKTDHYYQLMLYLWLTGIPRGWVLYEDKNDQSMVAIPVAYDERVIYGSEGRSKGLLQELEEVAQTLEAGEVPTRCAEAKPDKFPCKWKSGQCDFYDHCYDPAHNGRESKAVGME